MTGICGAKQVYLWPPVFLNPGLKNKRVLVVRAKLMSIRKSSVSANRLAEKAPDRVESFMLSPRTLVVFRKGILVSVEKELIEPGFGEKL